MYQKEAQLQLPQLLRASAHFLWGEEVTRKTGTFVAQAGKTTSAYYDSVLFAICIVGFGSRLHKILGYLCVAFAVTRSSKISAVCRKVKH